MDFEELMAAWATREFQEESSGGLLSEPPSEIVRKVMALDARRRRWSKVKRILILSMLALLCIVMALLTGFNFLNHKGSWHQIPASAIAIVIAGVALPRVLKQRDRLLQPRYELRMRSSLEHEQSRLEPHIRLERRNAWLIVGEIACVGIYFAPPLSPVWAGAVYWAGTFGLMVLCGLYGRHKIRRLEAKRAYVARQLHDFLSDGA